MDYLMGGMWTTLGVACGRPYGWHAYFSWPKVNVATPSLE